MEVQSYQELTVEVLKELQQTKLTPKNLQKFFFDLSNKEPERFKKLFFDANGDKPFSGILESILFDLKVSGQWGNF